ncbi:hypothetical protein ACIQI8_17545 [Streptomyces sp. NPDC092369]|uniref:hypothetical protein n=1 Tax=Streptomyces sp. NPDC092369 TaxID=3366015 RepID=UPI0037F4EA0E
MTDHKFALSRGPETLTLTTNYAPGVSELTWDELQQVTDRAKPEAYRLIITAAPELHANTWLRKRSQHRRPRDPDGEESYGRPQIQSLNHGRSRP